MESYINHAEARKQIPARVLDHLNMLIKDSGLENVKNISEKMIELWLLKKASFIKMSEHAGFTTTARMDKNAQSGCSLLTESGSLVFIGPPTDGKRWLSYTSIGLRTDVPKSLKEDNIELASDIECGKPLLLSGGRIEQTSIIADISVRPQMEPAEVQSDQLAEAENRITSEFAGHNRNTIVESRETDSLRRRDDLFNKWIINTWFELGGIEKHVFAARSKMLWLELFPGVYDWLSEKHGSGTARDNAFLDFSNTRFSKFCDEYKWYESEKKDFDIGLMKALEEIPDYPAYWDFVADFYRETE